MVRRVLPLLLLIISVNTSNRSTAADYLHDVKPLLRHKCYACHGALKQQGGLRLDTAAKLIKGGDSGIAIVPGKPDESFLLEVMTGEAGFQMPPANEGTPFTDEEISVIRQWISGGASAPDDELPEADPLSWWSYRPIERPDLPQISDADWCHTDIDYFVAAQRVQHDLPHVSAATKEVWLRRVFLDLTGLPPTREEQHQFLDDDSPSAWETVVDDLLSRPQYGERWGRHWMDVWRYSDWYGSRGGNEIRYSQRHIWRWRDWIVSSLNDDKGYDQMIREMLAADEIAGGDADILPATGFLGRNWYKFDRDVWMFETVERTGEAFLGLTFRCCRCHDHKFDPVTQKEYYRFRAFFEPHDVRTDPISALTKTQKDATLGEVLNDGIACVYDKTPETPTYRFERGDSRSPDETNPLTPGVPHALGGDIEIKTVDLPAEAWYPMLRKGVRATLLEKSAAKVSAAVKELQAARVAAMAARKPLITATETDVRQEVLLQDDFAVARPDLWQPVNGTWEYKDGRLVQSSVSDFATFVANQDIVGDFHIHLRYRALRPGTYRSVGLSFDYLDKGNSQDVYTSTGDKSQSLQAFHRIHGKQVYPQEGIVATSLEVGEEIVLDVTVSGSSLTIDLDGIRRLDYVMPEMRRNGKFALWVHQGVAEFLELTITKLVESRETRKRKAREAERAVAIAQAELTVASAEEKWVQMRLTADIERHINRNTELADQHDMTAVAAKLDLAVLKAQVDVLKAEGSGEKSAEAQKSLTAAIAVKKSGKGEIEPLGQQYPGTSTGRRSALATWITSRSNPRTARVAANHVWARHFGQPLVSTPENFGLNGRKPTHPLLLDWLASELIANDWKMKPLHRQLVLSATYRMASVESEPSDEFAKARQADGNNVFLWRMNSRRMEAEVVRDSVLHVADRLDTRFGGPEIPEIEGEKTLRRSLYFRNTPNEKMLMLEVFDVADPNACYRRKESVVPAQSLAMMNSGLIQDTARMLASRLADKDNFVAVAFETILSRQPTSAELQRCRKYLKNNMDQDQRQSESTFPDGGTAQTLPSKEPAMRAKENLLHVLFLHNDFVAIR
jgi:hypothetical protein